MCSNATAIWSFQRFGLTGKNELLLAEMLCLVGDDTGPRLGKCHEMGGTQEWTIGSQVLLSVCLSFKQLLISWMVKNFSWVRKYTAPLRDSVWELSQIQSPLLVSDCEWRFVRMKVIILSLICSTMLRPRLRQYGQCQSCQGSAGQKMGRVTMELRRNKYHALLLNTYQ